MEKQECSVCGLSSAMKRQLISAVIAEWPPGDRVIRCIRVQQDGAEVHIEQ